MTSKASTGGDPLHIVATLIEAGQLDTMYRDVYLGLAFPATRAVSTA